MRMAGLIPFLGSNSMQLNSQESFATNCRLYLDDGSLHRELCTTVYWQSVC